MDMTDRESAITALTSHHFSQEYRLEDHYRNVVNYDSEYLGPYIPFIGEHYFDTKPRLLIYAMSQNLAKIRDCIRTWNEKPDKGLLRQYYYPEKPNFSVGPYDNGNLKVIAAFVFSSYPSTCYKPTDNIDDLVSITNFVKFSFYQEDKKGNYLDSAPPLDIYNIMWEKYCKYEVSILQPNVIIGVGNEVANALKRNLEAEREPEFKILKIPFPGRLNLNSRWIPKGKRLIKTENHNPDLDIINTKALLRGTSSKKGLPHMQRIIKTDWYYFREMRAYINKELTR